MKQDELEAAINLASNSLNQRASIGGGAHPQGSKERARSRYCKSFSIKVEQLELLEDTDNYSTLRPKLG
jgi:hypothetical protein